MSRTNDLTIRMDEIQIGDMIFIGGVAHNVDGVHTNGQSRMRLRLSSLSIHDTNKNIFCELKSVNSQLFRIVRQIPGKDNH